MLRCFWSIRAFQEGLKRSRDLKRILSRFGRGLGGQVGAKLGPSWLKNGAKFEKKSVLGVPMPTSLFGWVFVAKK